jgi:RNA polymerase sigma-54 factor
MQTLLDNLPLLAARQAGALMRLCGVDAADLAEMIAEIKALDPKPGLALDPVTAQTVVPDILMRPQPHGAWIIELNSETLPRVLVNHRYYATVSRTTRTPRQRAPRHRLQYELAGPSLQRENILRVATEIVHQQAPSSTASSFCVRSSCATSPPPSTCTRAR